jgi:hypothetical protein
MATELTRLTHKVEIQLYLVAESCTICTSRSRQPVRKLLNTTLYVCVCVCIRGPFEKFVNWRQCASVMQREAVNVMPSCSGGGNVVVACSSSL